MWLFAEKAGTSRVDLQNIVDANGLGIAVTGMVIVFCVLLLITGFVAALPKLLGSLETILPPPVDHHGASSGGGKAPESSSSPEEVIAAIGAAFHARRK